MNLKEAEKAIGYSFTDKNLLKRALTLSSADAVKNNERLEFFGDAILEFIVTEKIYNEKFSEGELTEKRKTLVSAEALEPVTRRLGLDKFLIKDRGDTNNKKAISSVYEAVAAAVYLDGGLEEARKFVLGTIDFNSPCIVVNYKGELQEFLQGKGKGLPRYETSNIGTDRKPEFEARIIIGGKLFKGAGGDKKQAEQHAAREALNYLKTL